MKPEISSAEVALKENGPVEFITTFLNTKSIIIV